MADEESEDDNKQHPEERRRDKLLKRLLKTPPQPRPKRDRKNEVDGESKSPEKGGGRRPR
jgi:hypothetical protein